MEEYIGKNKEDLLELLEDLNEQQEDLVDDLDEPTFKDMYDDNAKEIMNIKAALSEFESASVDVEPMEEEVSMPVEEEEKSSTDLDQNTLDEIEDDEREFAEETGSVESPQIKRMNEQLDEMLGPKPKENLENIKFADINIDNSIFFAKGGSIDEDLRFEKTIKSSLENMNKGDKKRDEMAQSKFGVSYDELHPLKKQDILDEWNKRFVYGNEKLAKGGSVEKFDWSEEEVRKGAKNLAEALTISDGVPFKVHDFEYDKGRGAGFELSYDGEKYDGGSYYVKEDGTMINAAMGSSAYGNIKDSKDKLIKESKSFAKGGSLGKDLSGNYTSTDDFVNEHALIDLAKEKFGDDWESGGDYDYDVEEIKLLSGADYKIIYVDSERQNRDKFEEAKQKYFPKMKRNTNDGDIFVVRSMEKGGETEEDTWTDNEMQDLLEDIGYEIDDDNLGENAINEGFYWDSDTNVWKNKNQSFAKGGSLRRTNNSPLLRYTNFEDGWLLNLLKLIPSRNQDGLRYKGNYKYGISRQGPGTKQEVCQFETLKEADKKYDELVDFSKTYSKIEKKGKVKSNYAKGGDLDENKEYIIRVYENESDYDFDENYDVVYLDDEAPNKKRAISKAREIENSNTWVRVVDNASRYNDEIYSSKFPQGFAKGGEVRRSPIRKLAFEMYNKEYNQLSSKEQKKVEDKRDELMDKDYNSYKKKYYAKGGTITGAGKSGLDKIKKTSKDNPSQMYKVTDDNYSNIGNFYLKNGKFAKKTVSNADYDFAKNKVSLRPKSDVIYKATEIEGKGGYFEKGGEVSDKRQRVAEFLVIMDYDNGFYDEELEREYGSVTPEEAIEWELKNRIKTDEDADYYIDEDGELVMAKGGETALPITNYKKNIMGTLSFDLKVKGMNKPQDFIVYPMSEKTDKIKIQSDKKFGEIHIATGNGILSKSGKTNWHLSSDMMNRNVIKFNLSKSEIQELINKIKSTTGKSVGNSFVKSDNSGAELLAEGGKLDMSKVHIYQGMDGDYSVVMQNDVFDMNTHTMPDMSIDMYAGKRGEYPSDISHWGKKINYQDAPIVIKNKIQSKTEEFKNLKQELKEEINILEVMLLEEKDEEVKKILSKEINEMKTEL